MLSVSKVEFSRVLKSIQWAVDEGSLHTYMSHCLLDCTAAKAQISACSHAAYVIHQLDCAQYEPLQCYVPFADLKACVDRAPADTITMELQGQNAIIRSGTARWKLNTLPVHDGLPYAEPENPVEIAIDSEVLGAAMKFVAHAQGRKDVRYYLNGTQLTIGQKGEIRTVATDGHRLAWYGDDIPNPAWSGILNESVAKHFAGLNIDRIMFDPTDNKKLWVGGGAMRGWVALIDGVYPDVSRLLTTPADTGSQLYADTVSSWYDAANRLIPFTGQNGVLRFDPQEDGRIELSASDPYKKSEGKDSVEGEYPGKTPRSFVLNAKIVTDALSQLREDVMWHEVKTPTFGQRLASDSSGVLLMEMQL